MSAEGEEYVWTTFYVVLSGSESRFLTAAARGFGMTSEVMRVGGLRLSAWAKLTGEQTLGHYRRIGNSTCTEDFAVSFDFRWGPQRFGIVVGKLHCWPSLHA
jgi:hypothetical protein